MKYKFTQKYECPKCGISGTIFLKDSDLAIDAVRKLKADHREKSVEKLAPGGCDAQFKDFMIYRGSR